MILQYNVTDSSLFVDATKMYQFKAKDSKIIRDYTLCLGNILKDFAISNAKKKKKKKKKTGLKGSVIFFSLLILILVILWMF